MIDKRIKNKGKHKKINRAVNLRLKLLSLPVVVIFAVVLGVGLGLFSFYLLMYLETRKGTVLLPNYIGTDIQIVEKELRNNGFRVEKIGDSGKVINMDPPGNTVVKRGRKIKLFAQNVVEKSVLLPDFSGTWYKSVQNLLRLFDIDTVTKKISDKSPNGTVLQTSPTAGNRVKSGDIVTIFISTGGEVLEKLEKEDKPDSTQEVETSEGIYRENAVEVIPPEVSEDVGVESSTNNNNTVPTNTSTEESGEETTSPNLGGTF